MNFYPWPSCSTNYFTPKINKRSINMHRKGYLHTEVPNPGQQKSRFRVLLSFHCSVTRRRSSLEFRPLPFPQRAECLMSQSWDNVHGFADWLRIQVSRMRVSLEPWTYPPWPIQRGKESKPWIQWMQRVCHGKQWIDNFKCGACWRWQTVSDNYSSSPWCCSVVKSYGSGVYRRGRLL